MIYFLRPDYSEVLAIDGIVRQDSEVSYAQTHVNPFNPEDEKQIGRYFQDTLLIEFVSDLEKCKQLKNMLTGEVIIWWKEGEMPMQRLGKARNLPNIKAYKEIQEVELRSVYREEPAAVNIMALLDSRVIAIAENIIRM
jgi:hypothetical protein